MSMVLWVRRGLPGVVLALCALLAPGRADAAWLKAETARFVIYGEGSEQMLRDFAGRLEDFDNVLRYYHGAPQREVMLRKLDIYLVSSEAELHRVTPGSRGLAGFYTASLSDIYAIAIRDRRKEYRDDTLFHEYAHHFMLQYSADSYPAWLVEGWAEYFTTTDIRPGQIVVGNLSPRRVGILGMERLPLREVLTKRVADFKDEQVYAFYAEAWLLTHYMMADPVRREQLKAYVDAIRGGQDPALAMQTATGEDLAALERGLKTYADRPFISQSLLRTEQASASVTVTRLPASADDLLLENQRLKGSVKKEDRPEFLAMIRARAAKYPGDRLADLTLARAEMAFGDRAAGEATLARYAALDDAEALRMLALARIDAADAEDADLEALYADAAGYLVKANKAQPEEYRTLFAYIQTRSIRSGYPDDNDLDTLLLTQMLAPQVDDITLETARALMIRKRFDEARVLLGPVANDPHGSGGAASARKLLDQIRSYAGED